MVSFVFGSCGFKKEKKKLDYSSDHPAKRQKIFGLEMVESTEYLKQKLRNCISARQEFSLLSMLEKPFTMRIVAESSLFLAFSVPTNKTYKVQNNKWEENNLEFTNQILYFWQGYANWSTVSFDMNGLHIFQYTLCI